MTLLTEASDALIEAQNKLTKAIAAENDRRLQVGTVIRLRSTPATSPRTYTIEKIEQRGSWTHYVINNGNGWVTKYDAFDVVSQPDSEVDRLREQLELTKAEGAEVADLADEWKASAEYRQEQIDALSAGLTKVHETLEATKGMLNTAVNGRADAERKLHRIREILNSEEADLRRFCLIWDVIDG